MQSDDSEKCPLLDSRIIAVPSFAINKVSPL